MQRQATVPSSTCAAERSTLKWSFFSFSFNDSAWAVELGPQLTSSANVLRKPAWQLSASKAQALRLQCSFNCMQPQRKSSRQVSASDGCSITPEISGPSGDVSGFEVHVCPPVDRTSDRCGVCPGNGFRFSCRNGNMMVARPRQYMPRAPVAIPPDIQTPCSTRAQGPMWRCAACRHVQSRLEGLLTRGALIMQSHCRKRSLSHVIRLKRT